MPLSPAAAGAKVLTSVREPNANGWCLWASGTVKVLTQLFRQPCNATHSLSVYQLITAGRTVTESVQAPCRSFRCVAWVRADGQAHGSQESLAY